MKSYFLFIFLGILAFFSVSAFGMSPDPSSTAKCIFEAATLSNFPNENTALLEGIVGQQPSILEAMLQEESERGATKTLLEQMLEGGDFNSPDFERLKRADLFRKA